MLPRILVVLVAIAGSVFAQSNTVVISQVYGGGGNSGATHRNDFIELFNPGSNAVLLTGWSVQYASAAGSTWQVTPLSGSIGAGRYYLVQQSSGGAAGSNLPPADATGTISMGAGAGKVALVSSTGVLSGSCPLSNAGVVDLVGYGTTASCFEGNPGTAPSSAVSLQRAFGGCLDTDDNGSDFFEGPVTPRNSFSPRQACDVEPGAYAIHEIQGTNSTSPLANQTVTTTTNIVTGRRNNGFFIQTPEGEEDGTELSSEGVFVMTSSTPGTNTLIGHAVVVTGTVIEFVPTTDPASRPRTQINAMHVRFVSAENGLPTPVDLNTHPVDPNGGHEQLQRFEGMRVTAFLLVTGPTDGFINEANAAASSSGVFYGTGIRPFREPGIDVFESMPAGAPCCVPRFDGNPEILRVDSNGQMGGMAFNVSANTWVGNLVGPLFYEARRYTLLQDAEVSPQVVLVSPPRIPPLPGPGEAAMACLNLERFYDTVDHPGSDGVLTEAAYSNRLHKAGLLFRDLMHRPDILGLAEVENVGVLEDLAAASRTPYAAFLLPGNDPGGINVGFLVNTSRVQVLEVTQHGKNATFQHPGTGMPATLHDRPPLLLRATVPDPLSTNTLAITVIMNHLRSLIDIESTSSGAFVRAKRRAQAEYVATLAQQRQAMGEHVVVMGDFNAFEFNDGYVDVMGTIAGTPTGSNNVVLASGDLVEPDLFNLLYTLPAQERYSYVFDGTAQALDHILVSRELQRGHVRRFQYVRSNADFSENIRNDAGSAYRVSDHDAAMVYMYIAREAVAQLTITQSGTQVLLEGEGFPNRSYLVERSADLREWSTVQSVMADAAGRFTFADARSLNGAAFYRARSN